jgi:hypothetical protein
MGAVSHLSPAHGWGFFPFCLCYFRPMPRTFLYRSPNTGQNGQGWSTDEVIDDRSRAHA